MKILADGTKVVWEPLAGSQTLALTCPANIIVYSGTRGPGKTDAQLMRFRRNVGQGYGRYWRGIIFDREYKNLDDLVSKSMRWFPEFKDGARFMSSKADYRWVWPTGEELLFRAIKKDTDYWGYHGQEFCLAEFEDIIVEGKGKIPISLVELNDRILTANGYKRVTRIFPTQVKECLRVHTWDTHGGYVGSHVQSVDHKIMSGDGQSFRKVDSVVASEHPTLEAAYESLACLWSIFLSSLPTSFQCSNRDLTLFGVAQETPESFFSELQDAESSFELCYVLHQGLVKQLQRYGSKFEELLSHLLPLDGTYQHQAKQPLEILESYVPLEMRSLVLKMLHLDPLQQQELLQQVLCFGLDDVRYEGVLRYLEKAKGCQVHNSTYPCQYGELPPNLLGSVQDIALLQFDAQAQTHFDLHRGVVLPVAADIQENRQFFYNHPYSHEKMESAVPFQSGKSLGVSFGIAPTIDITVEDTNAYYTPNSCVYSSNCFIGWNELTKYPNDTLFESMMSCNRSSFIPSEHPYFVGKDPTPRLLPEIPLEIFVTTNPHGAGHNWVKKRFISTGKPGKIIKKAINVFNPRTQQREDVIKTHVHLFGSYRENKYLSPQYVAELESITDPNKRRAWLFGDWDIVAGGMFDDVWDKDIHVIEPFDIPHNWRIDRSYDHGESRPFSVGWWAESDGSDVKLSNGQWMSTVKGDTFRIEEWYGWTGKPNQGLRLLSIDIATGIVEREIQAGIHNRVVPGPADNSIWDVENGNSIAADMAKPVKLNGKRYKGVQWLRSDKAKGSRMAGWKQLRQFLKDALPQKRDTGLKDETGLPILISVPREKPGMFIFNNCKMFAELFPVAPRDEVNPDDIDTDSEDHICDEARYKALSTDTGMRGGRTRGM